MQGVYLTLLHNAYAIEDMKIKVEVGHIKIPEDYRRRIFLKAYVENKKWFTRIEDKGIGIKPEEIDNLFIPFHTIKPSSRERGRSLGLFMAKVIIEDHKDEIRVESEYGKGSTFTSYPSYN